MTGVEVYETSEEMKRAWWVLLVLGIISLGIGAALIFWPGKTLTVVTTIVGLTPMMLERSIQAAFLIPIVVSLAFGVFFAFFVTLLMVPSLYGIGLDINAFFGRIKQRITGKLPGRSRQDAEATNP